ncbi:MAG TPA: protein kinase [Ktedonobacteraceae bacterium]
MPRCPNPRCQTDSPTGTLQCINPLCQCLLVETVVAGRYRIETLIGIGGMGVVYRASDTFEMTQVALKVLTITNNSMDMPTAVERFRREARYAHQLQHKNIVTVLNFGQDGPLLYLAMPLITGGTLKDLLKPEQPLPMLQAQRYLNDLAAAIDVIHDHPQQIVHRDIKPSNLLVHQDDGRLVLADFGIARAMQQEKALTQRGWSLGTEHYIAPEQEQGKPEPASDIYAMGVVAYQMFTGLLPFQAVVRNKTATLPAPSKLNLTLPPPIDPVILRAMDIDPKRRFRSGEDFAQAVNQALASEAETIAAMAPTLEVTSNANIIIRTIIPENPCGQCGRENRPTSHFCRHCGHTLDDTSPLVSETYQVGYVSEGGSHTQDNEDMILIVQGLCNTLATPPRPFGLFAVADGLRGPQGKAAGGHEASRLAVETITDVLIPQLVYPTHPQQNLGITPQQPGNSRQLSAPQRTIRHPDSILESWTRDATRQANQVIYHCNADYETSMASTLAVTLLYKHHLYAACVGDSRIYHYTSHQGLQQLFRRSVPLQANGQHSHQHGSGIHYLGQHHQTHIETYQSKVETGDLILTCSNGLWQAVPDEQIATLMSQGNDIEALAQSLAAAANMARGDGNISIIVARVQ